MATSIESVKSHLSGNKSKISVDIIIKAGEDALALGAPNILGESWYTQGGKPIPQTPLIMALEKLTGYVDTAEQNLKLEELIRGFAEKPPNLFVLR